jgi:predicted  nucleic acid-binding Zn-ribbon protein
MKAAPTAQQRLLDLQAVDTAIAQLQHRRRSLPEHVLIAEGQKARARLGERLVAVRTQVSDLELEVEKAEADLVPVRARRVRDQQRVDNGSVTDPKQLTALLEEIQHLGRRIGDLEDIELDLMERLEQTTGERDMLASERLAGEHELRRLIAARDAQTAELDAELTSREGARKAIAAELPADLVAAYDRIRSRSNTGAAALVQRRCSGCQLVATAADLARYAAAPADEVLRCVECDRILVRVAESGL